MIKYEGWREWQNNQQRESWERARMIGWYAISPHLQKGAKFNKVMFDNPYKKEKEKKKKGTPRTIEDIKLRIQGLDKK